jgi:renalase
MECDVLVIGAGVAGIAAAREIAAARRSVLILEKSRGVGGRAATRRIGGRPVDHGAQYFTARTDFFQRRIAVWKDAGVCREWSCGFPHWSGGRVAYRPDGYPRYCCQAGMAALPKYEARDLGVLLQQKVSVVTLQRSRFLVCTEAGAEISARAVLCTAPAPQTLDVLGGVCEPEPARLLSTVRYIPCLTAVLDAGEFNPGWLALGVGHEAVSWIAANGTKSNGGRTAGPFVVHASPEFSARHLEADPADAALLLRDAAAEITSGGLARASVLHAHRWRYAMVQTPLPGAFLRLHDELPVSFAGDAFFQTNLESAWFSGRSAGADLVRRLA